MSENKNGRNFNTVLNDHGKDPCHGFSTSVPDGILNIFDDLSIGVYIIQRGLLRYVDSHLSRILGYETPIQLIGKSIWEVIHPDDRKLVRLRIRDDESSSDADRHTIRVFTKDEKIIWVHMGGRNTIYQGRPANIGHIIDLTRFKKMELFYKNREATSQYIIDQLDAGIYENDLKGNITFCNNGINRIMGCNDELGIVNKNYRSLIDEKTAKHFFKKFNEIYKTGIPNESIIYEIVRPDGIRRSLEASVSLIRDEEGNITGFRVFTHDITVRRKAEKELAEHRSRLEAIFRTVKDAIITFDTELRVVLVNQAIEGICRISMQEIKGKSFSQSLNQCSKSCCEVIKQALEKGATIKEYRIECDHQQCHQQLVAVTSSPLMDSDGISTGAMLVIRDITLLRDLERELRERHRFQNIIGKSNKMQDIYRLIEDLANLETTVLITGESGTGKELVAKALHYSGQRAFGPFIAVNCSALTESLLESELFGHVKGAFTGAVRDKQGRFQAADGGTILLDEIGDISSLIQLKLLRVLQEKVFERVGESNPRKADVRVIACTNKDLKEKVRKGTFREDLYYRLKVVEVPMPPLRDRLEDLPFLVDHFRLIFNERFKKEIDGLSNEVLGALMSYPWPGNVRELEHVIEHTFVLCQGKVIIMEHLPAEIRGYGKTGSGAARQSLIKSKASVQEILDALSRADGNKAKAARLLGINRSTIYRTIN